MILVKPRVSRKGKFRRSGAPDLYRFSSTRPKLGGGTSILSSCLLLSTGLVEQASSVDWTPVVVKWKVELIVQIVGGHSNLTEIWKSKKDVREGVQTRQDGNHTSQSFLPFPHSDTC